MTRASSSRENYFFNRPGENTNVAPVVYQSEPAKSSVGWSQAEFFQQLGDPRHQSGSSHATRNRSISFRAWSRGP